MPASPIPALDPAPIPGPPWLFHLLWVVTFLVHLLFVNVVLGGSVLGTAALAIGPGRGPGAGSPLVLREVNAWAISLAITFGIAPLLFMQVLYGRFFYTATVLVAWAWLGMLGLLMAGYYLNYVAKYRLRPGRTRRRRSGLAALLFLADRRDPGRRPPPPRPARSLAGGRREPLERVRRPVVPAALPPLRPRRGLDGGIPPGVEGGSQAAARRRDGRRTAAMARFGVTRDASSRRSCRWPTASGSWSRLPGPVLKALMRGGMATMGSARRSASSLGSAFSSSSPGSRDPIAERGLVRHAMELVVLAIVLMVITRHQVRDALPRRGATPASRLAVAPQWGVFALFLVAFVGCVGLTVMGDRRRGEGPPGGRRAGGVERSLAEGFVRGTVGEPGGRSEGARVPPAERRRSYFELGSPGFVPFLISSMFFTPSLSLSSDSTALKSGVLPFWPAIVLARSLP